MENEILQTKRNNLFLVDFRNLQIIPDFNIRKDLGDLNELAESIFLHGVKQPLTGYTNPEIEGGYFITDGHRRYYACKMLIDSGRIDEIRLPLYPEKKGTKEMDRFIEMAIRNDGKQLTMIEFANLIIRLQKYDLTVKEISKKLCKSISHINDCLKLLEFPENIQDAISEKKVSKNQVLKVFKDNKNIEKTAGIITSAIEKTESATLGKELLSEKKTKVKNNSIAEISGKFDSIYLFKSLSKKRTNIKVQQHMKETHELILNIIDGKFDKKALIEIFYK